jgi:hypothetical protein
MYLGLPLSVDRLPKSQLLPYVDKLANRLPTWKGKLLGVQGRVILVKVVLSAMPIYVILALELPVWMINALEGICRGFLWTSKASARGGNYPIAWSDVCLPTRLGGLGIRNLHVFNDALRMKWLWLSRAAADKPWAADQISCSANARVLFQASTSFILGNGRNCLFGRIGG